MPQGFQLNTGSDLVLSGTGNVTGTRNFIVNGGNWQIAYPVETFTTGDFYWEIIHTTISASNNATVGVSQWASNFDTSQFVGGTFATGGNVSVGLASTGTAYTSNSAIGSGGASNNGVFAAFTAGQIVGVALHLAVSGSYIAWRVGSAGTPGNWNNNAANTPATGAYVLAAGIISGPVGSACATTNVNATGDSFTGYFSSSSWQNSAPIGFSSFDAGVGAVSALETGAGLDTSTAGYLLTVSISEFA